jgi:DNA-binding winged helix-turn-helix (wHTH) protein/TolB-like protein
MMRFDGFDVDPEAGILRRDGVRVKLQDLPFRLLVILLRRPGSVITRDELRQQLWGAATFVDAEAGLNTAIAKLREALNDAAEAPKFIETLPKRGYRFVGTLDDTEAAGQASPGPIPGRRWSVTRWLVSAALLVLVVAAVASYTSGGPEPITIAVVRFHNETGDAAHDRLAETLTDAVVVSLAGDSQYGVIGNSPLLRTNRIFQDVRKIAGALNAQYVVLGQLQQADGMLVARAHLIRASDETHLWAGKIDLADVNAAERLVTGAVSQGVAAGLSRR